MKSATACIKKLRVTASIFLLAFLLSSCTKEAFTSGETKEFTLRSAANGATYEIKVGLPDNYNPAGKYATVYVLDGKEIFGFVSNRCKEISDQQATKNVLVVSIGYGKDRSIDYTPTKMSSVTGGAPEFLNFIEKQLIPKMEQDYQADTSRESRVILGHSYGGLFGVYAFCVNNKVFGNYILLSPSLWFDKYVALQMEKDNRLQNKNKKHLVFMGIGANEESVRMLAPFETFHQLLRDNYSNIELSKNIETNTSHLDSRNPNIIKGLNFYFQNR
jgi:predicted alpha/beta superfamily hydrolase